MTSFFTDSTKLRCPPLHTNKQAYIGLCQISLKLAQSIWLLCVDQFIWKLLSESYHCLNNTLLPLATMSPLSGPLVQPCLSLADPPPAAWMDSGGQYTDPTCPLFGRTEQQQRPVCSADCITVPLTSKAIGLKALMQLCNTSPGPASQGYWRRNSMWQYMGLLTYHFYTGLKKCVYCWQLWCSEARKVTHTRQKWSRRLWGKDILQV